MQGSFLARPGGGRLQLPSATFATGPTPPVEIFVKRQRLDPDRVNGIGGAGEVHDARRCRWRRASRVPQTNPFGLASVGSDAPPLPTSTTTATSMPSSV